jgi:hypothetical protein
MYPYYSRLRNTSRNSIQILEIRRNHTKIKSVSGIACYAKNLNKTVKFYETWVLKPERGTQPMPLFTRTGSGSTSLPQTGRKEPNIGKKRA